VVYVLAGSGITNPVLIGSISNVINMVCTVPALFLIDVVGRRKLFLAGSTLMAIFLFLVGALEATYGRPNPNTNEPNSWIVPQQPAVSNAIATFSFLFVAAFAMTWGPCTSVYPPEIFHSRHRAKAMSVGSMANWFWNVMLGMFFPVLIHAINWKTYILFGALNVCGGFQIFFMTPETKLRTLEEMDEIFSVHAWRAGELKTNKLDELARDIQEGKVHVLTVKDAGQPMIEHQEDISQTTKS
jgi:MFS family permease